MRRFLFAAFTVTVLASCQPATTELTVQQKGEMAAEVELVLDSFWDAWRAADVDRGMSYYLNSPEMIWASGDQVVRGWTAVNDIAQAADIASQAIILTESHTTVVALGVVHVMQRGSYSVTTLDGTTGPAFPCTVSSVWVRSDGEWKAQFVHVAQTLPEAA